jgi:uncharacterized protein
MKILFLILITSCTHLFYHPTKVSYFHPKKFVHEVEDVWMNSKDGTKLNAWWMPTTIKHAKGTIVFFHGNAENISSHFLNLAWITHEGYNLFIFDYRGYGASEGTPNPKGIFNDSFTALNQGLEFHQKTSPDSNFIVYGQSLGGVVALRALQDWEHIDQVNLIVQDSTFMSYQDVAFDKLKSFWGTFLFSPIAYLLISDEFASDKNMEKINRPMLIISGESDLVVPHKFSEEIYKKSISNPKWFWKIKDGHHGDVFALHEKKYRAKFLDFLDSI